MALDVAKIVGTHLAVGAIAAVPVPGSLLLADLAQPKICSLVLGECFCCPSSQYAALVWTKPICELVGKAAAIAAVATFLACGVISGPVGIGLAIAGISILGLCLLGTSAVLGVTVYNTIPTKRRASPEEDSVRRQEASR